MKSYFLSVLAILAAAIPGCFLAWWLVGLTGFTGVAQALSTVFLAMFFSVLLFAGLAALGRLMGITKP